MGGFCLLFCVAGRVEGEFTRREPVLDRFPE